MYWFDLPLTHHGYNSVVWELSRKELTTSTVSNEKKKCVGFHTTGASALTVTTLKNAHCCCMFPPTQILPVLKKHSFEKLQQKQFWHTTGLDTGKDHFQNSLKWKYEMKTMKRLQNTSCFNRSLNEHKH